MKSKLISLCALTLGTLLPASAADSGDTPTIQALLKRIEALEAQLKKQSDKTSPVVPAGKEDKLSLGGYIQANSEFGGVPDARFPATDRFLLRRARLGVKGVFAEHFDFTLQGDFGNNSIGGVSGYRAQITDCFVTWTRFPSANVTLGQFKTPYGFEQLMSDTKTFTVERSLPSDQLTLSRQIGAMVNGNIFTKALSYSAGLFNGNGVNNGANDNEQFLYVGRLNGTLVTWKHGRVSVGSGAFSSRDTGTFVGRRTGTAADVQVSCGLFDLQGEYLRTHFDRDVGSDTDANGWSVLGAVMVVPNTLQGLVRYERYDPNRAVANDDTEIWTVGFNYFIKGDDLKLSVNYLLGNPPGITTTNHTRLLTRFQVIF